MRLLFCLLIICGLSIFCAAESPKVLPDTKALWEAYLRNPDQNADSWENAVEEINDQIEQLVLAPDPKYNELLKKYSDSQKKLDITEKKVLTTGQLKDIYQKLITVTQQLESVPDGDKRNRDFSSKLKEKQNLQLQIRHLLAADPEIMRINKEIADNRAQLVKHIDTLISTSVQPAANVMRATKEMAKDYFDPDSIFLTSRCKANQNMFADLYLGVSHDRAVRVADAGYQQYLVNVLRRENPNADVEKINQFAQSYADGSFRFSGDPQRYLATGETPFDELYNTAAASDLGAQDESKAIRRLQDAMLQMRSPSFTKLQTLLLSGYLTTNPRDKQARQRATVEEALRLLTSGMVDNEAAPYIYGLLAKRLGDDDWITLEKSISNLNNLNSWLEQMIHGRAALSRAWAIRGNLDSYSSAPEENPVYQREMLRAKIAFTQAVKLHPNLPQSYIQLLAIAMAAGATDTESVLFKKIIRLDPLNQEAYQKIAVGLSPRWRGSVEQLLQLGDATLDFPYYDTVIPAYGFDMMGHAVMSYPDYRWKNIYLRNDIAPKGDRLFAERRQGETAPEAINGILYHRALFEMATLRYDQAAETVAELGGEKAFDALYADNHWDGQGITGWAPRMPEPDNRSMILLRLFTGPCQKQLRSLETRYLEGEDVSAELLLLIKNNKFPADQKDALCDLYGRWTLDCGSDEYRDDDGNAVTALQLAAAQGNLQVFKDIISLGYDYKKYETYPGQTVILLVNRGMNPEMLPLLKQAGDTLDRTDPKQGKSPLHLAAAQTNPEMLKQLLSLGVAPDCLDRDNRTPLQIAAATGNIDGTRLLLAAGANPDRQDKNGKTAIMLAMTRSCPDQVWQMLIERSKNLNIPDDNGQTALHLAAQQLKQPDAIRALMAAGANSTLRDAHDETPADLARKRNRVDLANLLDKKTRN